jgi:hypothetical protein
MISGDQHLNQKSQTSCKVGTENQGSSDGPETAWSPTTSRGYIMGKSKVFRGLPVLAACLFLSMTVAAKAAVVDLTVGGDWYEFDFSRPGDPWSNEFSFKLLTPGILTVTDGAYAEDIFEVFNNGKRLGLTEAPIFEGSVPFTTSYDEAAKDPRWSTGVWKLDAGEHRISGFVTQTIWGGSGALRVDPVPVPGAGCLARPLPEARVCVDFIKNQPSHASSILISKWMEHARVIRSGFASDFFNSSELFAAKSLQTPRSPCG